MPWLLDTNVWIQYLKGRNATLGTRIDQADETDLRVCSVVKGELLHGALHYAKSNDRADRVRETLAPYDSLPFDDAAAESYARIRHDLEQQGQVIGPPASNLCTEYTSVYRVHLSKHFADSYSRIGLPEPYETE